MKETKTCGDCAELKRLSTGSLVLLICKVSGRSKWSYADVCDVKEVKK